MKTAVSKAFGGFLRGHAVLGGLFVGACIFSPDVPKNTSVPTVDRVRLDSVTTLAPQISVELFEPYLDARLAPGGQSTRVDYAPVRVREQGTGRIAEYSYARQGFGSWSAERERQFNLLVLRAFFLKPGIFDSDSAGALGIDSLYARARRHDAYTRYIDSAAAEEYRRQVRTTARPRVLGIRIRLNDAEDTVFLEQVAPRSPADKAGLKRGMPVLAVDDSVVTGDSAFARFYRFVEADTVSVRLTVGTPQGSRTETVTRDTANFPTVLADSAGGAGYIAVFSFTSSTVDGGSTFTEFRKALNATRRFPATVLDLRGNGGGSLNEVLRMCDEVIASGALIRLVERNLGRDGAPYRNESTYRATTGSSNEGRSFVLLADGGSASASELFIAALRERLNTPLVGATTYGKGVGQIPFDTPGGGVAVVTYSTVLTASGVDYNGIGIAPTHPAIGGPNATLAQAVGLAVPGALAKRNADGTGSAIAKARVIEWNRRQGLRPDVKEWGTENRMMER